LEKQKIKMLSRQPVSPDHTNVTVLEAGQVLEVGGKEMPDWLAERLLEAGFAEEVGKPKEKEQEDDEKISVAKARLPREPGPKETK